MSRAPRNWRTRATGLNPAASAEFESFVKEFESLRNDSLPESSCPRKSSHADPR